MSNNSGSKFFDGLLWGTLLGGAAVFFLGTKKGRKLFKIITEEGLEGMGEIGNLIQEYTDIESDDLNGELEDEPKVEPPKKTEPGMKVEEVEQVDSAEQNSQTSQVQASESEDMTIDEVMPEEVSQNQQASSKAEKKTHRFFRGIPKRN